MHGIGMHISSARIAEPRAYGIHIAGILTVLLQCPKGIIKPHIELIKRTIHALVVRASYNDGHLPSSLQSAPRLTPLVQICHGSPGLALLLWTFRREYPDEWLAEWDQVERKVDGKIWEEGLLQKGLGVCHGVTGNAWPWLNKVSTDGGLDSQDLGKALAFMVHAMELPPMAKHPILAYLTPDHPYSLFEGLAGAICAWADTCAVIRNTLDKKQVAPILGVLGLGGLGPSGML